MIDEGYYPVDVEVVEVKEGDVVMKSVRNCFSKSEVLDASAHVSVDYESFYAEFDDVIITGKLLDPGCSGSSVWS
jgi:hypothetical protein